MKTLQYVIVVGKTVTELQRKVSAHIKHGWQPLGGPIVAGPNITGSSVETLAQAMTRDAGGGGVAVSAAASDPAASPTTLAEADAEVG